MFGPSSKLYKTLDKVTPLFLDYAMVFVDTGIECYENIQNKETPREIASDVVIDLSVGVATVATGTFLSTVISGAVAGSTLGTVAPGIGNVIGFAAGLLVSIGGYFLGEWLDDII